MGAPLTPSETLAVIGDPVAHSLSPCLHAAAISAAGLRARYLAIRVPPAGLPRFIQDVRGGSLRGFNVTVPHKEAVVPLLDTLHDVALELRAVNTVVRHGTELAGHNTDVVGFRRALETAGLDSPRRALILGAGGAARAAAHALRGMDVDTGISARRRDQAEQVHGVMEDIAVVPWEDRETYASGCDLVVNATTLGMADLANASAMRWWPRGQEGALGFDLVYGRRTPYLQGAHEAGWAVMNGFEMLVQQAAESYRLWFGSGPDLHAMRQACTTGGVECYAS